MSSWQETDFGTWPAPWVVTTVGQLVEERVLEKPLDGNHGEIHPKGSDFVSDGIPFVMATDISNGKIDLISCKFISRTQADLLSKGFAIRGDVLLTHKATLGRTAIVGDIKTPYIMLTPQVTYYRVANPERLHNRFLKYYFDSPFFQETLVNHGDSGSTRAYVGITAQRDLPIILPDDVHEQKAIAAILSSLDDKIDLLHRQNKTLEAMAETLFRQWFMEEVSEDWEQGKVEDLFVLQRGFDLPAQNRIDGPYPIYAASGKSGGHTECKVKGPGVTTGRSGLLGKVFLVLEDFWPLNTSLYVKEFRRGTPLFSYFFLKTLDLNAFNAGSAVPTLNRNHVHGVAVQLPPSELISRFETTALPLLEKIKQNESQMRSLETLRDTLLPRLMSGEVRVAA